MIDVDRFVWKRGDVEIEKPEKPAPEEALAEARRLVEETAR